MFKLKAIAACAISSTILNAIFSLSFTHPANAQASSPSLSEKGNTKAIAIVLRDQAALRAAARDSGQAHAQLTPGDVLEVRGERMDYLQVYDYRRERAGFVKASSLKRLRLSQLEAPELLAVMRHIKDAQGQETLGIGFAAAYLKIAALPSSQKTSVQPMRPEQLAEALEVLGTMAERIAMRASSATVLSKTPETSIAAQLDLAKSYGLQFESHEAEGRLQVCYDQAAFKQLMEIPSTQAQKAVAALARTRPECLAYDTLPSRRITAYQWGDQLLSTLELADLPGYLRNRLHLRRAYYANGLAFHAALAAQRESANSSTVSKRGSLESQSLHYAAQAQKAFALVQRSELPDDDISQYNETVTRLGATRWAAIPMGKSAMSGPGTAMLKNGLFLQTEPGAAGEVCLTLVDPKQELKQPLIRQCSYGLIWLHSASMNIQGTAITLAAQPLEAWREMWVIRKSGEGWVLDVLPPSSNNPEVGYVEFAGYTPDGSQVLVAREIKILGRHKRIFEVLNLQTLNTDRQASDPSLLNAFARWQDVRWKAHSLSLR